MQLTLYSTGPAARRGEFWIGEREVDTDRIVCYTVDIINNKRDI